MRNFLVFAFLAFACGGGGSPSPDLDPGFNGSWNGPARISSPGYAPYDYTAHLFIVVNGQDATVSDVCFGGSGSFVAHGSGGSATWSGSYTCAPYANANCNAITQTFTSASAA